MVLYELGKTHSKLNKIRLIHVNRDTKDKNSSEKDGEKLLGNFATFLSFFKGFINTGCLFLPKTVADSGQAFSAFAIIVSGLLCCFTSIMILETAKKTKIFTFTEIGRKALGMPGVIAANFAIGVS